MAERQVLTVSETVQQRKAQLLLDTMKTNWTDFFICGTHSDNGVMVGMAKGAWPDIMAAYFIENPQILRGMMVAVDLACQNIDWSAAAAPADNRLGPEEEADLSPEDLGAGDAEGAPNLAETGVSPILGPGGNLQPPSSFITEEGKTTFTSAETEDEGDEDASTDG